MTSSLNARLVLRRSALMYSLALILLTSVSSSKSASAAMVKTVAGRAKVAGQNHARRSWMGS